MPMVTLGTLSVTGAKGIAAMRRKLLAVAQLLGVNSIRAIRLASAASDHAKDVTRNGALEVGVELGGSTKAEELCVDFLTSGTSAEKFLNLGF
ncbi:MAG TPA: hypothetical protein VFP68_20710, partial [Burkholderiaceae bacterium]|nr:hypothetical protein [Burkholderiaceae bacterium]